MTFLPEKPATTMDPRNSSIPPFWWNAARLTNDECRPKARPQQRRIVTRNPISRFSAAGGERRAKKPGASPASMALLLGRALRVSLIGGPAGDLGVLLGLRS